MQLLIFNSDFAGELVKVFEKAGIFPLVDALHVGNFNWLKSNFVDIPHRCYSIDGNGDVTKCREGDFPSFIWYYNINDRIYETDWFFIDKFVVYLMKGEVVEPRTPRGKRLLEAAKTMYAIGPECAAGDLEEDMDLDEDHKTLYRFRECIIQERDVGLFEIYKPYTELPYTVVVRQYEERGKQYLFSSLYICDSWGVSRFDSIFLHQLWEHLGLPGELDLENLLMEATEKCFPGEGRAPEPEPEVYRRTIEQVLHDFDKRECGH
jgi:hypothetical protein